MEGLWSIQWEVVMARVWSMVSLSSFLTSRTVAVIICRHGSQPSATVSNLWVDRPQVSPVFEPILLCHPLIVVYKQLRRFSNVWKGKPWCLPKSCFKALKACLSSIQAFPSFGGFIENPEVAIFHWTQEFPYLPFGCRWGMLVLVSAEAVDSQCCPCFAQDLRYSVSGAELCFRSRHLVS